ncbi:hypothetical protein [Aurantiacibacter luteus]|uniref:Uncharacterized protein n=1 Tax=Aurantiacibacter luteus TaxID=1581420 RepID=A0A0G9MUX8_9SPHN|nr:hypothetical protein [Aurantiacibacter luteus]KLE34541.1 hypothetical protein AAW00_10030 [Aurantiacibacter luteus]
MSLRDRAEAGIEEAGLVFEGSFEIVPRHLGEGGGNAHAVQFDNILSLVVASGGEAGGADYVLFDRNDGIASVKLWPTDDFVYYVECMVSPNPAGTLIWGAAMGATPPVHSQRAIETSAGGKRIQYFTTPPYQAAPDGQARFWFTMQDGEQGSWALERIGVVAFRRP